MEKFDKIRFEIADLKTGSVSYKIISLHKLIDKGSDKIFNPKKVKVINWDIVPGIKDKDGTQLFMNDRVQITSTIGDSEIVYEGLLKYVDSIGYHILIDKEYMNGECREIPRNKRKPFVRKRTKKVINEE